MKLNFIIIIILSFVLFSCVEGGEAPDPAGAAGTPVCAAGSVVALQSARVGGLGRPTGAQIAQSFTVNCTGGVLNTIEFDMNNMAGGTTSFSITLYGGGSPGSFNSLIDTTSLSGITSVRALRKVTFGGTPTLVPGTTYWLEITPTSANSIAFYTSDGTDNYTSGELQRDDPFWAPDPIRRDMYFKIEIF